MKKHSLYLREDQIAFLKSLPNASSFIREALDVSISGSRGNAERIIAIHEGIKELETKIVSQNLVLEGAQKETEKIEEKIKQEKFWFQIAQNIARGNFEVKEHDGKFRVLYETEEGENILVTKDCDTKEEAQRKGVEKGKEGIRNVRDRIKELQEKKRIHKRYVEAQKTKLKAMEDNLQNLYASMK